MPVAANGTAKPEDLWGHVLKLPLKYSVVVSSFKSLPHAVIKLGDSAIFNRINNFVRVVKVNGYKNFAACWAASGEKAWDWPVIGPEPDGYIDVLHETALAASFAAEVGDSTFGWRLWTPKGSIKWPHGRFA